MAKELFLGLILDFDHALGIFRQFDEPSLLPWLNIMVIDLGYLCKFSS